VVILLAGQIDSFFLSRATDAASARFVLDLERQKTFSDASRKMNDMHVSAYRMMTIADSLEESAMTELRQTLQSETQAAQQLLRALSEQPEVQAPLREEIVGDERGR
jgi:hypothetical protein